MVMLKTNWRYINRCISNSFLGNCLVGNIIIVDLEN